MQLHEIYLRSPLTEVYIPLRQPERKIVSGERYTLMRKRGGQSLSSIVASPRDCGHLRMHQRVSFCPFNACAFASVLVAMAERAMEGVLGAGGAPSASCLQAPK